MREFDTGATRDTDEGKLDFEGFLSHDVLVRYAEYMNENRVQADGNVRSSDNWQKGIPQEAYMKSAFRHFMDWWKAHRGQDDPAFLQTSLCALLFNVLGYMHEELKKVAKAEALATLQAQARLDGLDEPTNCRCEVAHGIPAASPEWVPVEPENSDVKVRQPEGRPEPYPSVPCQVIHDDEVTENGLQDPLDIAISRIVKARLTLPQIAGLMAQARGESDGAKPSLAEFIEDWPRTLDPTNMPIRKTKLVEIRLPRPIRQPAPWPNMVHCECDWSGPQKELIVEEGSLANSLVCPKCDRIIGYVGGSYRGVTVEPETSSPVEGRPEKTKLAELIDKHEQEEAKLREDWPDDMVEGHTVGRSDPWPDAPVREWTEKEIAHAAGLDIVDSDTMRERCRHYWQDQSGIKLPADYTLYFNQERRYFTIFDPVEQEIMHSIAQEEVEGPEFDVVRCERKECSWEGLQKELPSIESGFRNNPAYVCPDCGRQFERVLPFDAMPIEPSACNSFTGYVPQPGPQKEFFDRDVNYFGEGRS